LEYHRRPGDPIAVGVLHANVGGVAGYDPYAPATLEELRAAGMDYWALGHIHKQEVLSRDPWVAYAGSPQGLNPKEIGAHGCFVVEVGRGGSVSAEQVETAPIAWARDEIDVSAADGLEGVRDLIAHACERLLERDERHVIARLTLVGRSAVHADLARPGAVADLLEDVRAEFGSGDPWLWLDRLEDRTGALLDLDALRGGADFAAEIVRVADEMARDPELTEGLIAEIAAPVSATLPGGYGPGINGADALETARDLVLDRLVGGETR
jgi:DNA repair exonuclease SbcCD nuclease subunit